MVMIKNLPKVAVLLATHNGIKWLAEQVKSILAQQDVIIKLIVSDDASSDGTLAWLESIAKNDSRVVLLPATKTFGTAGKNFYRLIIEADISDCDYIALSDQDDIWFRSKLKKQINQLLSHCAEGVSSNVVAFWPEGARGLICKSNPKRKLDFIFESSGPGCTFLISPWLHNQVKILLSDSSGYANQIVSHDWLIYAVCRALGRYWYINPSPTMKYRQHGNNVLGANYGAKAHFARFQQVIRGHYRAEVIKICSVCKKISDDPYIKSACTIITDKGLFARARLLGLMPQARRSFSDRLALTVFILLFIF